MRRKPVLTLTALGLLAWFSTAASTEEQALSGREVIQIKTSNIAIQLAAPNDGMGFVSIRHQTKDTEFLKRPGSPVEALIWKIELLSDLGKPGEFITLDNRAASIRGAARDGGRWVLRWNGVKLPDGAGTLDVMVTAQEDPATGFTAWRINVKNHSNTQGIYRVIFPVAQLGRIGRTALDDYLIASSVEGRSLRNPIGLEGETEANYGASQLNTDGNQSIRGFGGIRPHGIPYPSARGQMQLNAYYEKASGGLYYPSEEKGAGLYLTPHDGQGYPKLFFFTPKNAEQLLEFEVANFPDDSARPGLAYNMPYPMLIGGFDGDWYDAARIYRQFALQQKWAAKGPLHARKDLPDWIKQTTGVLRIQAGKQAIELQRMNQALKEFSSPLTLMWYIWSKEDYSRPHLKIDGTTAAGSFPPRIPAADGFGETVAAMQAAGVHVFPYVNTRLWNVKEARYHEAEPHVKRTGDGQAVTSTWGPPHGFSAAHLCVQDVFWKNHLVNTVRDIARTYKVHGFYLDQGGEVRFGGVHHDSGCYDRTHGHPLGVTKSLVDGERDRFAAMLQAVHEVNPQIVFCAESGAECFIGEFANRMTQHSLWAGMIPLYGVVYHDYQTFHSGPTLLLAPRSKDDNDPTPAMHIGWQLVRGDQLARLWTSSLDESTRAGPLAQANLAFLRKAFEVRNRYGDFLSLGQMLRPPYLLSKISHL